MYAEIINYAMRSTACLAFFYAFYSIILRKETCFRFNRVYLLTTLALSFILPAVSFSISLPVNSPINPNTFILPEIIITDTTLQQASIGDYFLSILNICYFLAVSFLLVRLSIRMYRLWKVINSNRHLREDKYIYQVIPTNGLLPTSSFLNYLFWDNTSIFNESEKSQIIEHERVHILERHTYDILLIEGLSIIFWFNPVIWLWRKAISENHEYLADAKASSGIEGYSHFLAKHTLALNGFAVIHPFKSSEVINRLKMLKKYGKRTKLLKLLAVIPLLLFMIFTMSFSVNETIDQPMTNNDTTIDSYLSKSIISSEKIQHTEYDNPKEVFLNIKDHHDLPKKVTPKSAGVLGNHASISRPIEEEDEDEVFTIVEESASPRSGEMTEFYQYVARSMKYPNQARKLGIEGRVFVEFVVDKHGNLTDVKAIKGIGAGCDTEAVRVISEAPAWKPGKQRGKAVKQKIVLPISFKLG